MIHLFRGHCLPVTLDVKDLQPSSERLTLAGNSWSPVARAAFCGSIQKMFISRPLTASETLPVQGPFGSARPTTNPGTSMDCLLKKWNSCCISKHSKTLEAAHSQQIPSFDHKKAPLDGMNSLPVYSTGPGTSPNMCDALSAVVFLLTTFLNSGTLVACLDA